MYDSLSIVLTFIVLTYSIACKCGRVLLVEMKSTNKTIIWLFLIAIVAINAFTTSIKKLRLNKVKWQYEKIITSASRGTSSSKLNWAGDFDVSVALYDLQLLLETKISQELTHPTFASLGTLYTAGDKFFTFGHY